MSTLAAFRSRCHGVLVLAEVNASAGGANCQAEIARTALGILPPLRYRSRDRVFDRAARLHAGCHECPRRAPQFRRRSRAVPPRGAEGQHKLQRQCLSVFPEVCCDRHDLPFRCTGPLDLEPARYLSAARSTALCLHRSPEFFAVPFSAAWIGFRKGKVCKAKLYECPWRNPKRVARSRRNVGRRGEEIWGMVLGVVCDGQLTPCGEHLKGRRPSCFGCLDGVHMARLFAGSRALDCAHSTANQICYKKPSITAISAFDFIASAYDSIHCNKGITEEC